MNHTQRVLVIDDDADIREGVSRWLKAGGYEALAESGGQAGIETARENPPDAILLDVLMPEKSGLETLAELRANEQTRGIPVLMLSASLRDEQRALEAGARFFVNKPYEGKALLSAVQRVIQENECNVQPNHEITAPKHLQLREKHAHENCTHC